MALVMAFMATEYRHVYSQVNRRNCLATNSQRYRLVGMTALSELLAIQMRKHKLTQEQVAIRAKIRQPSVAALCSGSSKTTRFPDRLAAALNVPVTWVLAANRGERPWLDESLSLLSHRDQPKTDYVRLAPPDTRMIPVISYIRAGYPAETVDAYVQGNGFAEIAVDAELAQILSSCSFALSVEGNSMAPEYQPGDVVVIDPESSIRPGDVVVAKLDADEAATLKKYRDRGRAADGTPIIELVPLNDDYPTIVMDASNPGRLIGPVIEHRRRRRKG